MPLEQLDERCCVAQGESNVDAELALRFVAVISGRVQLRFGWILQTSLLVGRWPRRDLGEQIKSRIK